MLRSYGERGDFIVAGASGGIGQAVAGLLGDGENVNSVTGLSRRGSKSCDLHFRLDYNQPEAFATLAGSIAEAGLDLRGIFIATGFLHDSNIQPEKSVKSLDADHLHHAFQVNAVGPAMLARSLLPLLPRKERCFIAFLSARVGSISDNRLGGWHSYRASKAALNMLVRNLAIELGRRNDQAICVSLHPGTVDTELSRPFSGNVPDGGLFSPEQSAKHLLSVLDGLGPDQTGGLFAWDGQAIPF